MREYLSLVNSLLLLLIFFVLGIFAVTDRPLPSKIIFKNAIVSDYEKQNEKMIIPIAQIYGRKDLFDLSEYSKLSAVKTIFTKKIPQLVMPEDKQPPEKPKNEFLDPLKIDLNGIIFSSSSNNSMCIFADETGKEKTYKVGDKIKDGVIILISKDRVVILRNTGQQETFYLKEIKESELGLNFQSIFQTDEDNVYTVNIGEFTEKISSLGELLEELDIAPILGEDEVSVTGIMIVESKPDSLAQAMGFASGDIITSINNNYFTSKSDRIKAYEEAMTSESLSVMLERNDDVLTLVYNLKSGTSAKNLILKQEVSEEVSELKEGIRSKSSSQEPENRKLTNKISKEEGLSLSSQEKTKYAIKTMWKKFEETL